MKTTVDELGNKVAETLTSMLCYANPVQFIVGTSKIQPVYLGISPVASTNLSMNLSLYCIANEECTLMIQIQLDGEDITFTPKQKLLKGNKKYIDDMAVIEVIEDNREATRELVRSKEDVLVYHTGNKDIVLEVRNIKGYRGIMQ